MQREKIGIFGCTADPFTLAHREIVKRVLEQKLVDAVIIAPTIVSWHREGKDSWLSSQDKVEVIKSLSRGLGRVYVDDTELRRKDMCSGSRDLEEHAVKSWRFIDTLMRLKLEAEDKDFYPIIGSDELANFKNWFAWEEILKQSAGLIAAVGRNGEKFDEQKFILQNHQFEGKLKTIAIDKKFSNDSATKMRKMFNGKVAKDYIDYALNEIAKPGMKSASNDNMLLHTPIFDVIRGKKTESGLEPIVVNAPDWVTIIAESNGKVIVEKQYRYGSKSAVEEFPCGMVEKGEDPLDAAVRELEEETGHRIIDKGKVVKLGQASPNPAFMSNTMHYYYVDLRKAKCTKVSQKLDPHEKLSWFFKDIDKFCQSALSNAKTNKHKVPAMLLTAISLLSFYKMQNENLEN